MSQYTKLNITDADTENKEKILGEIVEDLNKPKKEIEKLEEQNLKVKMDGLGKRKTIRLYNRVRLLFTLYKKNMFILKIKPIFSHIYRLLQDSEEKTKHLEEAIVNNDGVKQNSTAFENLYLDSMPAYKVNDKYSELHNGAVVNYENIKPSNGDEVNDENVKPTNGAGANINQPDDISNFSKIMKEALKEINKKILQLMLQWLK